MGVDMKQTEQVLAHLQSGRKITPKEALSEYGIMRLGARIWDLKQDGFPITKEMVVVPTRDGKTSVARYALEGNGG